MVSLDVLDGAIDLIRGASSDVDGCGFGVEDFGELKANAGSGTRDDEDLGQVSVSMLLRSALAAFALQRFRRFYARDGPWGQRARGAHLAC